MDCCPFQGLELLFHFRLCMYGIHAERKITSLSYDDTDIGDTLNNT